MGCCSGRVGAVMLAESELLRHHQQGPITGVRDREAVAFVHEAPMHIVLARDPWQ
jgi:hypothetical protein